MGKAHSGTSKKENDKPTLERERSFPIATQGADKIPLKSRNRLIHICRKEKDKLWQL